MKKLHYLSKAVILSLFIAITTANYAQNPLKDKRVLVFSKTMGFRHASIPQGVLAIQQLGKQYEFQVDTTEDNKMFTEDNLKKYRLVIFNNTTGNVLQREQEIAFERFIQAGGGYIGIHSATDTEYDWAWYGGLSGGYFASHPGNPNVQEGKMMVVNKDHPATSFMDNEFIRKDEFYDFKKLNPSVNVLIKVDEKSYKEGKMGDNHPMAWYHEYDGGRAFYTNWGHTSETFTEPLFLKHLWGGMIWAASGPDINYNKPLRSMMPPEENRFVRTVLDEKLDEPTELAVTDAGKVFYIERKGKMKMYNPKTGKVKLVAQLDVYSKHENGLMGLNIDPNYNQNKWVYLFYSPPSGQPDTAQRLSRFVYDDANDVLLLNTEKIMLRVPVKRYDCCHTGGSIEWDKNGNLYLSTGDDTNPFASDGYAPIDDRPGRDGWDARASSSNTNDLRGKILRIKPKDDGTYDIPDGNLFPKSTEKARPEIYVMGNRNPYRISVDKKTGFLYWGEVGPDAGNNSERYGPRGHDEVNQARKAGYFGWPLFVGDNKAYFDRSFKDTLYKGPKFDSNKPINNSPHNTGLIELPPAQKAFIWYPYAESPDFGELVGKGGRNAMAGPVYYQEDFKGVYNRFPEYFEGKFFAYDWMRDWINLVTMKPNGDFHFMERFLPNMKFSHPIDMQFGKDGALYMLEYGQNWFSQNDDARLTKIVYNPGNRTPVAEGNLSKTAGSTPLTVQFSAKGSMDYDNDPLSYEWTFMKGKKSKLANPSFTFKKQGVYKPVLKVKDAKGNVATKEFEIKVGNEPPVVDLGIKSNKTFFWDGGTVNYEVKVTDKEDGSLTNNTINPEEVRVSIDFLEGFDKTVIAQGHQRNISVASGLRLIELSDCKACHAVNGKSIGPSYTDIAKKYHGGFEVEGKLSDRIIKGGGGVWGEQAMAAHPQITKDEAKEMVRYILSLADEKQASKPLSGGYQTVSNGKEGAYILSASYSDRGANGMGSQLGSQTFVLRSARFRAATYDDFKTIMKINVPQAGGDIVVANADGGYIGFKDWDLTGLTGITVTGSAAHESMVGGTVEARLDSPMGQLIGSAEIKKGTSPMPMPVRIPFDKQHEGSHSLYLVFVNPQSDGKGLFALINMAVEKD
jgi:cytochrome c